MPAEALALVQQDQVLFIDSVPSVGYQVFGALRVQAHEADRRQEAPWVDQP